MKLVTYDKNNNGQIDGINEIFGNLNENGFEEIKRLIDSNSDNKIDRKDELFYRLETWNDFNQDGKVQDGELKSLHEAGVKSIDLNYVSTNIDLNGNLLSAASKYTDSDGNKELAADIQLNADLKDTKVEIGDIPNFTIDESTRELPQFKGSGLVYDAFIKYNIDEEFKALAEAYATDISKVAGNFESYIDQYSGYTEFVNEMQERYSVDNFQMAEADKQAWIVERFEATDTVTSQIENYYHENLNSGKIPTEAVTDNANLTSKYNFLSQKLENSFALQSLFKDTFLSIEYDVNTASFTVENQTTLHNETIAYFNDSSKTVDEKLYLAHVMQMQQSGLEFDINSIVKDIDNEITQELVRDVYAGSDVALFENRDTDIIIGSSEDEFIKTDTNSKILLSGGDDKVLSGDKNNTFYFRRGDGTDTIHDKGGYDKLVFDEGIDRDDVIVQLNRNKDLIIAIKDGDKTVDELSDKVIMVDWMKSENRVEKIEFGDGLTLKFQDVFDQFVATDDVDTIRLSSSNDILDTKGGNDAIRAMGGNDTLIGGKGDDRLEGGSGNDTYLYGHGDGKDTIVDISGYDTLQFKAGVTHDDLMAKFVGSDLLIAIKEDGKTFDEFSDVVILQDYKNKKNKIEAIFLDGYNPVSVQKLLNTPTENSDIITLGDDNNRVDLLGGDDVLTTGYGDDNVIGGNGDDTIYTNAGADILAGGEGADKLEGGKGNDTYIFNRGDGRDTIFDDYGIGYQNNRKENAGEDTLRFGEGIGLDDIVTKYSGLDLLIGIKDGDKSFEELSDVIKIKNYIDENNKVEHILLSDGNKIEINPIRNGTEGSDRINLKDESDDISIQALGSSDFIHTGSGNDHIHGGIGTDDIYGGAGNDVLIGDKNADALFGGSGDDVYIYNRGDSSYGAQRDIILDDNRLEYYNEVSGRFGFLWYTYQKIKSSNTPHLDGGNDTLKFGEGISANDVTFKSGGTNPSKGGFGFYTPGIDDLIITIADGGGEIIIREYFNTKNSIENFILSDGTVIEAPKVTTGDNTYTFNLENSLVTILDQGGDDTIKFGEGIIANNLIGKLTNSDFTIALKEDGKTFEELSNKITIKNYTNSKNKIENIEFADGNRIETDSLLVATEGDDTLIFGNDDISIDLLAGNDTLTTGSGNDTILGGAGNDTISTSANADTIDGGLGDDTLKGGAGNDTYIFSRGDGKDTISDEYYYYNNKYYSFVSKNAGNDTIKFGEEITVDNLIVKFLGNDFVIALKEDGKIFEELNDKITIKNYINNKNKIENIEFADGSRIETDSLLVATEGDDTLIFGNENISINMLAGNDTLTTGNGNNTISGGAGDDTISTGFGKDNLNGGKGTDRLEGGLGNDTYIFNRGDGKDTIYDNSYYYNKYGNHISENAGNDTLKFGENISQNDIVSKVIGSDFVIALREDETSFEELSDKIIIKNYKNSNNKIENIIFNDGSQVQINDTLLPTENSDYFIFGNENISINMLAGNDTLTTGSGNDTVLGGSGNDTISTGASSDTIDGGLGDDTLKGGLGNDTYIFNRGDGKDTILDSAGNDTIKFTDNITESDLLYKQDNYNLTIALKENGKTFEELTDKIIITNWFKKNNNIETIEFSNGSILNASVVGAMVLNTQADTLFSNHGAQMTGGLGDDTYIYKKDDFTVIINDQYFNKEIEVNAGNDTLKFEDINQDKVTIGTKDNDLIIKIDADRNGYIELKDYVVIKNWQDTNKGIEQIIFGDGEVFTIDKSATFEPLEFDENWITSRYYIYGSEDNIIEGTTHSEVIESGAGDDTVLALEGNDYITGGIGNDTLDGGAGNDTYVFNIGDGTDTIIDKKGVDTIKFASNITQADLLTQKVGNDLVIAIKEDGKTLEELTDKVILTNWFDEDTVDNRVELISLEAEGTIAIADFIITPTEGNDNLEYGDENNNIDALAGDDTIHIGGGDDTLIGNSGNDTLYGGEGDDTISGDSGVDTLYGAEGDDTYIFGQGDGKDTIVEDDFNNWGNTGNDTLRFKDGITTADLIIIQNGDDLIVALKEDGKSFEELSDKITLKKWSTYDEENSRDYSRDYYAVENFSFSDGASWSMNDIIANIGTNNSETIHGFNNDDTLEGQKGDDTLHGYLGDDTYIFNRGDGRDTIYDFGRKGDDYSYYDAGNDTLKFGEGIGVDDLLITKYKDGIEGDDVYIALREEGKEFEDFSDVVTLKNWFDANNRIENVVLHDGTVVDFVKYINGEPTEFDDRLIYGDGDDLIDALAGDDIVISQGGDDIIDGNSGNDDLQGGDGNDTLIGGVDDDTLRGGSGDDKLEGDSGNDTYIFGLGDGHDTISDYTQNIGEVDKLNFGTDIIPENLEFIRKENDLTIIIDENNSIKVENWFLEDAYKIEELKFIDDTILSNNDVENRVKYYGDETDNTMIATNNSSEIYGLDDDDTITGNRGDDTLYGGDGNDTYIFNLGDGHDTLDDFTQGSQDTNKIIFGEGIVYENIQQVVDGDDMVLTIDEQNSIRIKNWETNQNVTQMQFTDGTITTFGNTADNTITSGTGIDYMFGGAGDDTYIFDKGAGRDFISDTSGIDTVKFAQGITTNDLFVKKDGDTFLIALYEDGKDFDTFADMITISENSMEKIEFADGSSLDIDAIILANNVEESILEQDQIATIYTGSLNEDNSNTPHNFNILSDSIAVNSNKVTDLNITVIDAQNGEYKVDGNFDALVEGEEATVTFAYEVNYDSDNLNLISGVKNTTLTVTGTNDIPTVTGVFTGDVVEGTTTQATGTITVIDADYDESELQTQSNVNGTYGTFNITSDGNWTYDLTSEALSDGESAIETFTVVSKDGAVSKDVVIDVIGMTNIDNRAPVVVPQVVETQVNSYTNSDQGNPNITTLNDGGYVVTWESWWQDGSRYGVYLQQFNHNGEKVGLETQVNSYTNNYQEQPDITALNDGGYIVTWESWDQDGSNYGVYLQQFNHNGEKIGLETQVNSYTNSNQENPNITALNDGRYVVAWNSFGQDGFWNGVYIQQFNNNGEKIGLETQVNSYTNSNQENPNITALNDGGYVVAWESNGQDGSRYGVYLQQFNNNGEKIGLETQVNSYTNSNQENPNITALNDGGYVVTWESNEQDGSNYGVYLQQFNNNGEKIGLETQVNNYTNSDQKNPNITALNNGGYVVTWESNEQDGSNYGVYLQQFNHNGEKIGLETQVNSYTNDNQMEASVSGLNNGGYVVTWSSDKQDGSGSGIYLQQFDSNGKKVGNTIEPNTTFNAKYSPASGNLNYIKDHDGDTLIYTATATNGVFEIDANSNWTYTPNSGFNGVEEINILIEDGKGNSLNHTLTFFMFRFASPIILDLNNNSITSTSLQTSTAYFDYNGDGIKEHTAWMEKGDAQLVTDINQDGKINDGSEIFGEFARLPDGTLAKDGYEALAAYDTNGDRVIDSKDDAYGDLLLWQDKNSNGKSEEGELTNIQLTDITAINLDIKEGITFEQTRENGNIIIHETNYSTINGDDGIIRDVGFAYDATDTITNNDTLDSSFEGTLSGEDGDDTYLYNLGDGIVTINDNGDGNDILKFGENITKEQLIVKWDKENNGLIIGIKESAADTTPLMDLENKIILQNWFTDSGSIENINFSNDTSLDRESIYDILLSTKENQELTAKVLDKDGELTGGNYRDVLYGDTGEEKLQGLGGNDFLKGEAGDDLLIAGDGDDSLEGGKDDDTLMGESGDDYYIYNRGDGRDLIIESSGYDVLMFGEGISQDNLIFQEDGYDLLIGLKDGDKDISELSDIIRIQNQLIQSFEVENIEFYDGSTMTISDINDSPTLQADTATIKESTYHKALIDGEDTYTNDTTYGYKIGTWSSDDKAGMIKVNTNDKYTMKGSVTIGEGQDPNDKANQYLGFVSYDIDGNIIYSQHIMKNRDSTDTTLAKTLQTGDTELIVNDATGWDDNDGERRFDQAFVWYGYQDSTGKVYDDYTYTRNHSGFDMWDKDDVSKNEDGTWTIKLKKPWEGESIESGVAIRNSDAGATFNYAVVPGSELSAGEHNFEVTFGGKVIDDGVNHTSEFRAGTAYIKPLILDNYSTQTPVEVQWSDISIINNTNSVQGNVLENDTDIDNGNNFSVTNIGTIQGEYGSLKLQEDGSYSYTLNDTQTKVQALNDGEELIEEFTIETKENLSGEIGTQTLSITIDGVSDSINGDNTNNILEGSMGNDNIIGLKGDDKLFGKEGDDIYYFSKGDGEDIINDQSSILDDIDTISLGSEISKEDIAFFMQEDDLIISYGDEDLITIQNQSEISSGIEKVTLSEGSYITSDDISLLIQNINSFASENDMQVDNISDIKQNDQLMSIIAGGWSG